MGWSPDWVALVGSPGTPVSSRQRHGHLQTVRQARIVRWWVIVRGEKQRSTPIWRLAGCCVGSGFWLSLSIAIVVEVLIERSHPDGLGPPLLLAVAATSFVFEVFAGLWGGTDLFNQDSFRWREKAWRRAHE